MPDGRDVRPERWSIVVDIFDNGDFSVIWGHYDDAPQGCLGIRWNGESGGLGFPNQFGKPTWFVIPENLTRVTLHELWHSKNSHRANIENVLDTMGRP
jgi:hypothetical protein